MELQRGQNAARLRRLRTSNEVYRAEVGRLNAMAAKQAEVYRCPISTELIVDAVVAPDGRFYERSEIQRYLGTATKRSPVNPAVGFSKEQLIAVPTVVAAIAAIVECGVVDGAEAADWRARKAAADTEREATKHREQLLLRFLCRRS